MYPLQAVVVNNSETPLDAIRSALQDNAVTIIQNFPTIEALLATWPSAPDAQKRMLVVRLRSLDDVKQMSRLESNFPGWPLLAVVEGDVDSSGLYQVSRAGASQIIPYPFERSDFDAALDRLLLQFGLRESPCRVIVVCGVVEGCGATSLAINLAAELAALGEVPVVLTERTIGIGRLASQLNLSPATTLRDLLTDPAEPNLGIVQASLVKVNDHLSALVDQTRTLEPFLPPIERLHRINRILQQLASFIVVDLPSTHDPHFFEALLAAQLIFLVGRQDVPSMQAAKVIRNALIERGISSFDFVINHFDPDLSAFSTRAVSELLQIPTVVSVASDPSGHRAALNEGRFLRDVVPLSPAVSDVRSIAVSILEKAGIPSHVPHHSVWDRVKTFVNRLRA